MAGFIVVASAHITTYVTSQRWTSETKSAQNSITEVSFCTIVVRLSQCMMAITMVLSNSS